VLNERLLTTLQERYADSIARCPDAAERLALLPQGATVWVTADAEADGRGERPARLRGARRATRLQTMIARHLAPFAREWAGGAGLDRRPHAPHGRSRGGRRRGSALDWLGRDGEVTVSTIPSDGGMGEAARARLARREAHESCARPNYGSARSSVLAAGRGARAQPHPYLAVGRNGRDGHLAVPAEPVDEPILDVGAARPAVRSVRADDRGPAPAPHSRANGARCRAIIVWRVASRASTAKARWPLSSVHPVRRRPVDPHRRPLRQKGQSLGASGQRAIESAIALSWSLVRSRSLSTSRAPVTRREHAADDVAGRASPPAEHHRQRLVGPESPFERALVVFDEDATHDVDAGGAKSCRDRGAVGAGGGHRPDRDDVRARCHGQARRLGR